jgi:hypothetical protein
VPGGCIVPKKETLLTNLFIFKLRLSSEKKKEKMDVSIRKLIIIRKIGGTSAWRAHCSQERNIIYLFLN